MNEFRLAIASLTRIPVGGPSGSAAANAAASRFYPVVGAGLAVLLTVTILLSAWFLDRTAACAFTVAGWVIFTGGIHLHGLSNCFDGLAAGGNAPRRLQAMHDPRIGALGAVGLTVWCLLKFTLVSRCIDEGTISHAIWCALIFARTPLPFEFAEGEPATPGRGTFAPLHTEIRRSDWLVAAVVGFGLMLPAGMTDSEIAIRLVVGIVAGTAATVAWHLTWYRRIGGLNGDVVGGAVEIRELMMLLAMGLQLPW